MDCGSLSKQIILTVSFHSLTSRKHGNQPLHIRYTGTVFFTKYGPGRTMADKFLLGNIVHVESPVPMSLLLARLKRKY